MPGIHFDDLSFRYTSAVDLFDHLTVHLGSGWTGVVGENGTGKSTLLRLAAAELRPSSGRVVIDPPGASIVLCPQTVEDLTQQVEDFAASWDGEDSALRSRLDLDPADLGRWATLSPGERKRWQVGAALMVKPDVLLVDEPTNHLDAETRRVLVSALAGFGGAGMVVSHDRALLARLCRRILRVAPGDVRLWNGDYTTASRAWESDAAQQRNQLEALRTQERRMARELADRRRVLEEKQAVRRRQMRQAAGDHDVTSAVATYRAAAAQRAASRECERAATQAGQGRGSAAVDRPSARSTGDRCPSHTSRLLGGVCSRIRARCSPGTRSSSRTLLWWSSATTEFGCRDGTERGSPPCCEPLSPSRSCRRRGCSFSHRSSMSPAGRERGRALLGLEPGERGEVLAIVGSLGTDPERVLATELPSPGEARKLSLALGTGPPGLVPRPRRADQPPRSSFRGEDGSGSDRFPRCGGTGHPR